MNSSLPAYAILRIEGRRSSELSGVVSHNDRLIAVPNADSAIANKRTSPWTESTPMCAEAAIGARLVTLGLKKPNFRHNTAYEAIFTVSPHADPMPPAEVIEERGLAFCRREFGEETIIASWLHLDEKTPHLHVLGIPLVEGRKPGRPKRGQPPAKPVKTVSWNQFSGSNRFNFREAKNARAKAVKTGTAMPEHLRNPRFVELQSAWALMMADYGLRRGIPSNRSHRPPAWIRARTDQIEKTSDEARTHLADPANWLTISAADMLAFLKAPTGESLAKLVAKCLHKALDGVLAPLVELAKRGVQLPLEQQARASIADARARAERDAAEARSAHATALADKTELSQKVEVLAAENALLKHEIAHLNSLAEQPSSEVIAAQLALLSEDDLARVFKRRRQLMDETAERALRPPVRPALPTPQVVTPQCGTPGGYAPTV